MKPVAIIGAGITGLTTAFYLQRKGVSVRVYEAAGRAGGVIQSIRKDGFLAESGPNTLLETAPEIPRLISELNLESRRLYTHPEARTRFVVRNRRPVAMPSSPPGIFTSPLLSARGKLALLREPFVARRRDGKEESVAEFVTRRLNREFLDRLVDALVGGIYAGDPQHLSVRHALPRLYQVEAKYGSLIKGQFLGARERKKGGQVARDRAPGFSFDEGLQVLPDTLAARLGDALKLNAPVVRVAQIGNAWGVTSAQDEAEFASVIFCGTAYGLAELKLSAPSPVKVSAFAEIRYAPVASVVLGFRREDVAHPCQGFGMLIPKIEGFKILGTIFSSALFPNRAPAGHVLLTSYVGGERSPELAGLKPDELVRLTCDDLRILLGLKGAPVFQSTAFYPRAIPQYNVGYGKFKENLDEIESNARGLFFAGHFRDGVSLGDSIVSGANAAGRVEGYLK
ncbi:MAG TPA: protoporphyrinogen oxidase [Alphaproteobacteria bacterium]|nr:protoporphyrinogen oxidase [Alphaproteobacteria bacterium]